MNHFGKGKITSIIVSVVLLCILFFLLFRESFPKAPLISDTAITPDMDQIQEPTVYPDDLLPKNLHIGRKAPSVSFQTPDGRPADLDTLASKSPGDIWLSFSEQTERDPEHFNQILSVTSAYGAAAYMVVSHTPDEDSVHYLMDPENKCRLEWGVESLPADIFLDAHGRVLAYHTGSLKPGEAEGIMRRIQAGRSSVNLAFIKRVMSDGNGSFYTNTAPTGSTPFGKDVLSESQGLMLMYALEADKPDLFEKVWAFTKENLLVNNLAAWYVTEEGKTADINAFLDDLRIWHALFQAGTTFDESYAQEANIMLEAIKRRCLDKKNRPVDFTNLTDKNRADYISLHYLDLKAMQAMKETDPDFENAYKSALKILSDGRISDEFPLYYKSYNYTTRSYDPDSLNTAEALYTFWNLSRVGMLPEESLNWLKEHVISGTLAARYKTNGDVVFGYNYHSTAVYALATLIAREEGDDELFETALRRMERKLILDADDELFGAYTQKGTVIYSFDQLIPLLVNTMLDEELIKEEPVNGKQ